MPMRAVGRVATCRGRPSDDKRQVMIRSTVLLAKVPLAIGAMRG